MANSFQFELRKNDFSVAEEYQKIRSLKANSGAIITFTGIVRELLNNHDHVKYIDLSCYPAMIAKQQQELQEKIFNQFLIDHVSIIHRHGKLQPNEEIVFVGVASQHRSDGFQAAQMTMDFLKSKLALWKKEVFLNSSNQQEMHRWVEPTQQDHEAIKKW